VPTNPPAPRQPPRLHPGPLHAPDSIVNGHGLLGSAGDGVVVLEEGEVAAGVAQQRVVGERVPAVSAGAAGVGERQAVQDLCPPAQGQSRGPCPLPKRPGRAGQDGGQSRSSPPARQRTLSTPRGLALGRAGGGTQRPGAGRGLGTACAVPGQPPRWWLCADGDCQASGPPPARAACMQPLPQGPAQLSSPEVGLQHPVQALVERPGGVVACPVVVLPVRVGEEIPTQHREPGRLHARHDAHLLVQSVKVVGERPKLCLRETTCSPERDGEPPWLPQLGAPTTPPGTAHPPMGLPTTSARGAPLPPAPALPAPTWTWRLG